MATKVTRSLKEIREEMDKLNVKLKAAQPELKNINQALRLDSSNVDLLNKRFENYSTQLTVNKEKIGELKNRIEELNVTAEQNGGLTDAQQMRLQTLQGEYEKTTAQVSGLESALQHQNQTIANARFGELQGKITATSSAITAMNSGVSAGINLFKNWENMSPIEKALNSLTVGLTVATTAMTIFKTIASNPIPALAIGIAGVTIAGIAAMMAKAKNIVPKYSNGGIVEDGLFQMNKGEVMGQFQDGTSFVANQQQQVQGLEEAAYRGISRALAENGGMGGNDKEFVIEINGREFVRAIYNDLEKEMILNKFTFGLARFRP
jgi:hypothetical protein